MDIERINQIGTQLADLTHRTEALRGTRVAASEFRKRDKTKTNLRE